MLLTYTERWANPALIDHLARVRQPWAPLTQRIACAVVAQWCPPSAALVVEIGAGGGQLREWLPPQVAAITTQTEPSAAFLERLRQRYPGAKTLRADATLLPFASGSVDLVLALCVFDTLPDLASVRDELQRVLRPGGAVIHFLDLATSPDCVFPELIAGGELPLTNFAGDLALRDMLTDAQTAYLPAVEEFDDILAVQWIAFRSFVEMLAQARHPLAAELGPYANVHRPGQLDPEWLADGFMAVSADPARLAALNAAHPEAHSRREADGPRLAVAGAIVAGTPPREAARRVRCGARLRGGIRRAGFSAKSFLAMDRFRPIPPSSCATQAAP